MDLGRILSQAVTTEFWPGARHDFRIPKAAALLEAAPTRAMPAKRETEASTLQFRGVGARGGWGWVVCSGLSQFPSTGSNPQTKPAEGCQITSPKQISRKRIILLLVDVKRKSWSKRTEQGATGQLGRKFANPIWICLSRGLGPLAWPLFTKKKGYPILTHCESIITLGQLPRKNAPT